MPQQPPSAAIRPLDQLRNKGATSDICSLTRFCRIRYLSCVYAGAVLNMSNHEQAQGWIGASMLRKEDARHLHGRGMFIADVTCLASRTWRSCAAKGRMHGCARYASQPDRRNGCLRWPTSGRSTCSRPGLNSPRTVTAPIRRSPTDESVMWDSRSPLRHADTRAGGGSQRHRQRRIGGNAGDRGCRCRDASGSPRVFDEWPSNAYISTTVIEGNPEIVGLSPVRLRRRIRLNRQATVSLEGRGVLAYWDYRLNELVVYLSTQGGQVKRMALARMLGLPEDEFASSLPMSAAVSVARTASCPRMSRSPPSR